MDLEFQEIASPFAGMRLWSARSGKWSFVISYESKTGPGFENWTGYSASWSNMALVYQSHSIGAAPYPTLGEARAACEECLKSLLTE